jgi:hypothetical protein
MYEKTLLTISEPLRVEMLQKKQEKKREERRVHLRCEHEYTKGARVHGLKWLLGLEICSHSLKKPAMYTWLKTQRT